jgi:elongator complex protein 2
MHVSSADDALQELIATPATGGHCGEVVDACWGAHNCLFTASTDRTIRITVSGPVEGAWYELARPQVHGHPFSAVAFIPPSSTNPWEFRYASASEEKVIRIFCAPSIFVQSFARLQGMKISKNITAASGARVSPLGLSNKAVEDANKEGCSKPESAGYECDTHQASQVKRTQIFEV